MLKLHITPRVVLATCAAGSPRGPMLHHPTGALPASSRTSLAPHLSSRASAHHAPAHSQRAWPSGAPRRHEFWTDGKPSKAGKHTHGTEGSDIHHARVAFRSCDPSTKALSPWALPLAQSPREPLCPTAASSLRSSEPAWPLGARCRAGTLLSSSSSRDLAPRRTEPTSLGGPRLPAGWY